MKYLYPLFLQNIKKIKLIKKNDTIIVALSGGKDSVTLTHLLLKLKDDIIFFLKAAYFNHKIRTDSIDEQEWVKNFCKFNNIQLIVGSRDVIDFKNQKKINLEHAASISRYQFFGKISAEYKNTKIATAHTRSDLTETFFIKLFRGSGLQGLSAIYSQKGKNIIRPLLMFTKEEILSFLNRNNIKYYRDYTNIQNEFLRNKIRNTLIPEINKIEPEIDQHIYKTVSIIQDEYEYLCELAKEILSKSLILKKVLPINILDNYHIAIKRNIVREYIRLIKGNLLNINFKHIEDILNDIFKKKGISIPGLNLFFHKGFILPEEFSIPEYNYTLRSTEIVKIKEIERKIQIKSSNSYKKPANNYEIIIPFSEIKFPLTIRNPQKNDKYIKINSSINQKVIEMIRTSGIPSELRNLCPVIINGNNKIIWVVGSPVSDSFKVSNKSDKSFIKVLYQTYKN